MTDDTRESEHEAQAEKLLDEWAAQRSPDQLGELDGQFQRKLERLQASGHGSEAMIADLRLFWQMVNAPDDDVPWQTKRVLMAALWYFASPVDLIPDFAGKLGYMDDAAVLRVVRRRLADTIAAFQAARDS